MKKIIYLVILVIFVVASFIALFAACGIFPVEYTCSLYDTDEGYYVYTNLKYSATSEEAAVEKCKAEYDYWWARCTCTR